MRARVVIAAFFMQSAVSAAPLAPDSYSMPNGGSGTYTYRDDSYDGTGAKDTDYAELTGGTGDLTDGVIASGNWNAEPGAYVGWRNRDVAITFFFDRPVAPSAITFHFDNSNGSGGVNPPASVSVQGTTYPVTDPTGSEPFAFVARPTGLLTDRIEVTLTRGGEWTMLSEVSFEGAAPPVAAPLPTWLPAILAGTMLVAAGVTRQSIKAVLR